MTGAAVHGLKITGMAVVSKTCGCGQVTNSTMRFRGSDD